jgi:Homeodomain-like domain
MTDKVDLQQFRERAIALRRDGKSRREIKEITGVTSNRMLDDALRGVPPEPAVLRPRAKDDLHARARELRANGHTYVEIAAELGVSKSSVSLWVRDLPRTGRLSYEHWRSTNAAGAARYWAVERPIREARRQSVRASALAQIGALSERELLIAGAIAYWCEGGKNKPYRRHANRVVFINSDPGLILFFLRFLALVGISLDRVICQLQIHENADIWAADQYWKDVTGVPPGQFRRPTLKTHKPKTNRKNTGESYRGCLRIEVRRSADLYMRIEGWATAAMTPES